MEHHAPTSQDQQYIEKFQQIKKKQLMVLIVFVPALLYLVFSTENQNTDPVWYPLAGLVVIAGLIFSFQTWRCPKCQKRFRKEWNPKFCSGCGQKLQ